MVELENPRTRRTILFGILLLGFVLRILLSYEPVRSNDPIHVIDIVHEIVDLGHFDPLEHRTYGNRYFFLLYSILIYMLVGTNQLGMQVFYMVPSVLGIIITYKFTHDLTQQYDLALKIALLHATIPLELRWSGAGTLDAFFGFFVGLFFWLYYRAYSEKWSHAEKKYLYLAGLVSALLVSVRVLGFFVYIAIGIYLLYRRDLLVNRLKSSRYLIYGFLSLYSLEFIYLGIVVGNPLYGILRRIGFSAGGAPSVDLSASSRIDDPIYSLWRYPRMILVPEYLGYIGILSVIAVIFFLFYQRDQRQEISIWILGLFFILEWFPLFLIIDPVTVLKENKPWWFEKQRRFFTTFTILGLSLIGAFFDQIVKLKALRQYSVKKIINLLIIGLLITNMVFIVANYQPVHEENNLHEVTAYFESKGIDTFYVDHPGIPKRYEVLSHYTFQVSWVNETQLADLSCSYFVTNSSIREYSNYDLSNYTHWTLVTSFHSSAHAFYSQFWTYEFTTSIYFTNSVDQNCSNAIH